MEVLLDHRLGNLPRYYLGQKDDGLMLVPDEVRKCVVYVIYKDKIKKTDILAGTAFFVSMKEGDFGLNFIYLVTAKHVIDSINDKSLDNKVYLRVNRKDKTSLFITSELAQWKFHPTLSIPKNGDMFVDVAVLPWAPNLEIFDCRFISSDIAVTDKVVTERGMGCGDEVFITGLFSQHFGLKYNVPIIRIGNISCMPGEPVQTSKYGLIDAYLIEARSIGGLSGSPVFVQLGGMRGNTLSAGTQFYWLGLVHGHFDLMTQEIDTVSQDNLYNLAVNMGIAIVVPVSRILEVLNQDELAQQRKLANEAYKLSKSPTPDAASPNASGQPS